MVFGVNATRLIIAKGSCRLYSLSMPSNGIYCIGDGVVTHHVPPHQCRLMCLQSPICKAYNYNITDGTCTRLRTPCPQAFADVLMEFAIFSEKSSDQCYQWLPYSPGDAVDRRMLSTDDAGRLLICRMQRDESDTVCYFHTSHKTFYGSSGSTEFANNQGYPCLSLRISEDCAVSWVPYIAQKPVPTRSVVAGHTVSGDVVHVTKFNYKRPSIISLAGHYVEGADYTIGAYDNSAPKSTTMMMMVVL